MHGHESERPPAERERGELTVAALQNDAVIGPHRIGVMHQGMVEQQWQSSPAPVALDIAGHPHHPRMLGHRHARKQCQEKEDDNGATESSK